MLTDASQSLREGRRTVLVLIGGVSADSKHQWLSGRFEDVVYRFDTTSGAMNTVAVGKQPHGRAVWPQPGRYNLGHTGNLR